MAIICESPPFYPVRWWNFPTFGLRNPQYRSESRHQFSSFSPLGMKGRDQYYSLAATAICFYDFFLTLADEVSCFASLSPRYVYDPLAKDQIRLAWEKIMGCAGRITCRMAFIDVLAVFGIFIVVRSPPQQSSSSLKG